jgi:hypothetical protein
VSVGFGGDRQGIGTAARSPEDVVPIRLAEKGERSTRGRAAEQDNTDNDEEDKKLLIITESQGRGKD